MPTTRIREHLGRFGLGCKDPERLEDGTRVLGLAVTMEHGKLCGSEEAWFQTFPILSCDRQFSLCGGLSSTFRGVAGSVWLAEYSRGEQAQSQWAGMMRRGTTCCSV